MSDTAPNRDTATREGTENLVGAMIDEAESYFGSQVRPARVKASDYYRAEPFGTEEEGCSQVVVPLVRAHVRKILPSLMRIFSGPEHVCVFSPLGSTEDKLERNEELARQATDYVGHVFAVDNPGYAITRAVFKDALTRRTGVIKWGVEASSAPDTAEYHGLSEPQLLSLFLMQDVTVTDIKPEEPGEDFTEAPEAPEQEQENASPAPPQGADPATGVPSPAPVPAEPALPALGQTFSATVTRKGKVRRIKVREVPGEEILWDRDARDFESAKIVVHVRQEMPMHELLAIGFTYDELEEHAGAGPANMMAALAQEESDSRRNDAGILRTELLGDPKTRPVRYDEAYVYLDYKGRGVKLYKVCMVGPNHTMLREPQPVSHRPFALFTPDPEPHTLEGLGVYDDVGYLQRIESDLVRGMLDSLSLSLDPATVIVDGAVSIKDLMNPERGRIVRATQLDAVREVAHSFAGADVMPVLQFFESLAESTTGQSKASQGLDADVLQNTTKIAVAGMFTAAQQQIEDVARNFAESFRVLYRGLLRTVIENQDGPRMVRLRGKYVEVDPRAWDADMDVVVSVGLGSGLMPEDRLALLGMIAAKQEQALLSSPNNPLVKLSNYRNTLARITEGAGYRNAAEFWQEIDPAQEQAAEAAAAQAASQAPKDPNAALAQAEIAKAQLLAQTAKERLQAEMQVKAAEHALAQAEFEFKKTMEQAKLAAEIALQTQELEIKHGTSIDREKMKADVQRERAALDAHTKVLVADIHADTAHHQAGAHLAGTVVQAQTAERTAEIGAAAMMEKAVKQREATHIANDVVKTAAGEK
jgi:hypothetical protein